MRTKILTIVTMAFAAMMITGVMTASVSAQKKAVKKGPKTYRVHSARGSAGRGGADPNIKHEESANDPNDKSTRGTTRGGSGCRVHFDNSTSWFVKVYVDGVFRGTMDGWDAGDVYVGAGDTEVYARADFTDGSYRFWGPKTYDCPGGYFVNFVMIP